MRHPLVQKIIVAYEKRDKNNARRASQAASASSARLDRARSREGAPRDGSSDWPDSIRSLASHAPRCGDDPRQAADACVEPRPHPLVCSQASRPRGAHRAHRARGGLGSRARRALRPFAAQFAEGDAMLVLLGRPARSRSRPGAQPGSRLAARRRADAPTSSSSRMHNAFELMEMKSRAESRGKWLNRYRYELGELIEIARAITTERDIDKLLGLILEKSRFITGADAGSIYVVEGDDPRADAPQLRFKLSQNDSVKFDSREFTMPISARSHGRRAALHAKPINIVDVYDMPAGLAVRLRSLVRRQDRLPHQERCCACRWSRARTRSSASSSSSTRSATKEKLLYAKDDVSEQVVAFDERSEELVGRWPRRPGSRSRTPCCYEEIRRIFEGFVQRQRRGDRAARSHDQRPFAPRRRSDRGARARRSSASTTGPYREVDFTPRTTARDRVRLAAARLRQDRRARAGPGQGEEALSARARAHPRSASSSRCGRSRSRSRRASCALLEQGRRGRELARARSRARDAARRARRRVATRSRAPTSRPCSRAATSARSRRSREQTYARLVGQRTRRCCSPAEVASLSVTRGSLTPGEIDEIRSHVVHTYNFLSQHPVGQELPARPRHRRRAPREAQRHGLSQPTARRRNPAAVQDDERQRHLRRAHRERSALQARGARREGARHPGLRGARTSTSTASSVRIFCEARVWEPVIAGATTGPLSLNR